MSNLTFAVERESALISLERGLAEPSFTYASKRSFNGAVAAVSAADLMAAAKRPAHINFVTSQMSKPKRPDTYAPNIGTAGVKQATAAMLIVAASLALTSAPSEASAMTSFVAETSSRYHLQLASIPAPELSDRIDYLAIAQLRDLAKYGSGWNGPRSQGADTRSFKLAESLVDLLAETGKVRSFEPTIFSDGTATLSVSLAGSEMLLNVTGSGSLTVNVDADEHPHDLDITDFNGDALPHELLVYL